MTLKGKTLFITGGSRGIGYAIAMRAARDGANVVIAAKTVTENAKLPGTIHSAAADVEKAGGKALAVQCDIRFEDQVAAAIAKAVETFGGIDVLVNNASAISLTGTESTDQKRYKLMHEINVGGTFLVSKLALPHLKKSSNPHILTLSPPMNMAPKWFGPHLAYTMSKYGMSMCTLGLAEENKVHGVAANSLWPETAIATAAVGNLLGGEESLKASRKPEIVADAAYWILTQSAVECTGNFFIDTEVLKKAGVTDFDKYAVEPRHTLLRDFFLDDPVVAPAGAPAAGNVAAPSAPARVGAQPAPATDVPPVSQVPVVTTAKSDQPAATAVSEPTKATSNTDVSAAPKSKYKCFSLSFDGGVAHLRMSRPQQHNAMSASFWNELPQVFDEIEENDKVRVVVLSADGPSFSSGMDLSVFQNQKNLATGTAVQRERFKRLIVKLQSVVNRVANCRVPVIAAVQGPCIGAAFELVAGCDLRFATDKAFFSIHEINLGMMPDLGALQRLPKLMPESVVTELALTGDKLAASRAQALGLVSEVFADDQALMTHVMKVAGKIAEKAPLAVAGTRQSLRYSRDHSVKESLEMAATLQANIFNGADVIKAVMAQKIRTTAKFDDLDRSKIEF